MVDRVLLEGLEIEAVVGVYAHERIGPQRLVIDVAAHTDTRAAGASDALTDALDYDRIAAICRSVCGDRHHLIETVAERIAARVLAETGAHVSSVFVRVGKPVAVPGARGVAVEIERGR